MAFRQSLPDRFALLTVLTVFAGAPLGISPVWAQTVPPQTTPPTVPQTPPNPDTPTPASPQTAPQTNPPTPPATIPLAPPVNPPLPPANPPVAEIPANVPAVSIRTVTVEGTHVLPAKMVIQAAAAKSVGSVASHETLLAATQAVRELYRQKGYPVAEVIGVEVMPDGTLHLTVAEGTIRRIVVRGNHKTHGATILEAISLRPGDVYHENDVQSDRNRLSRLGIFSEVVISAQVPGTEETEKPLNSIGGKGADGSLSPDRGAGSTPTAGAPEHDAVANAPATPPTTTPTATPATPPATTPANPATPPANAPVTPPADGGTVMPPLAPPVAPPPPPVLDALPDADDEVGQVDLVVLVKERPTVNIAATVGYAASIGPVGFVDLSEVNLAGTAQRVGVQWQRVTSSYINVDGSVTRGDSRQALDLSYDKPALGLKSVAYSIEYYDKNTVFLPYFAGADETVRTFEKRHGATGTVGRAISHNVTGYLLARREDVGYDPLDGYYTGPYPPLYLLDQAQAKVGSVGVELVSDGRDAASNPHAGYLNTFTFEDAGNFFGGNRPFHQATLDLRSYMPLDKSKNGPIIALRVLGGDSSGNVPLPDFYFIGGYDLLRGYDLYSIYGDRMLLGTAELRAPLSPDVQGVVFIDSGDAWLPGTKATLTSLKQGAGIGLRFQSPIGPIRFDAAYGSSLKTYVTLGQSF